MSNNFLEFIENDIDAKKTLLSNLPLKTKTNKKKFNEVLESIEEKYSDCKNDVKNYLMAKNRSFAIKEDDKNIDKLKEKVTSLEEIRVLLNPSNTYIEKLGFDTLLYQINRYYKFSFDFDFFNEILNSFIDKFEEAGVKLSGGDFDYTCYVHEYMSSFMEVRYSKTKKYDKVSEIFEKIYWANPEIIEHIENNFRKLIREHSKDFESHISSLQKRALKENDISNYEDCIEKLKAVYKELAEKDTESVYDIVNLAQNGGFDINHYLEDSKIRKLAYESLIPNTIDYNDKKEMEKICNILEKLKTNLFEYDHYLEFKLLFNTFKEEYKSLVPEDKIDDNDKKDKKEIIKDKKDSKELTSLKTIEKDIEEKEKKLEKLNKKIFGGSHLFMETKNESDIKMLKTDSIKMAKELHELYKNYENEYFKEKILNALYSSMTISEVLHLYYSFDYFKKESIEKVYNIVDYNELVRLNNNFDTYAKNPTNVVITGIPIFDENSIAKVIANKYKLNSINVNDSDFSPENLKSVLNKILLILRVNKIENSETTLDKIWFMVQVEKIINAENKKVEEK